MFDEGLDIEDILQAIHSPEERLKWDKELTQASVVSMELNNSVMVWH